MCTRLKSSDDRTSDNISIYADRERERASAHARALDRAIRARAIRDPSHVGIRDTWVSACRMCECAIMCGFWRERTRRRGDARGSRCMVIGSGRRGVCACAADVIITCVFTIHDSGGDRVRNLVSVKSNHVFY